VSQTLGNAFSRLSDRAPLGPISEAQATPTTTLSSRPGFGLVYQRLDIAFTLVPVALALYLLTRDHESSRLSTRLGTDGHRVRDLGHGLLIFVLIGIGTLGVYAGGRALGITAEVQPTNLGDHWWT